MVKLNDVFFFVRISLFILALYIVPKLTLIFLSFHIFLNVAKKLRFLCKHPNISFPEKVLIVMFEVEFTLEVWYVTLCGGSARTLNQYVLWWMRYLPKSKAVDIEVQKLGHFNIHIYRPHTIQSNTGIIYYHGGAWALANTKYYDWTVSYYSEFTGKVVVSVDYGLTPKRVFPNGLIDAYNALVWVQKNAASLGIEPAKIVVMGDSAGGNLAAVVTMLHRQRSGEYLNDVTDNFHSSRHNGVDANYSYVPILGQVLIYPVVQGNDFNQTSYASNSKYGLSRDFMKFYTSMYISGSGYELYDHIGQAPNLSVFGGVDSTSSCTPSLENTFDTRMLNNPYMFPLMSSDLEGLPPAFITVGDKDVLYDDAAWYSRALSVAGVVTTFHPVQEAIHGFMMFPQYTEKAKATLDKINCFIDHLSD